MSRAEHRSEEEAELLESVRYVADHDDVDHDVRTICQHMLDNAREEGDYS